MLWWTSFCTDYQRLGFTIILKESQPPKTQAVGAGVRTAVDAIYHLLETCTGFKM